MMNVFQNSLKRYDDIPIKSCREIKFSHGGHLFAAATANHIQVYKFYTGEGPPELQFKGHCGRVKCISWLEDDSGFISCGWNGDVIFFKLQRSEDEKTPMYQLKSVNFSCVVNVPIDEKALAQQNKES
jgi:WD40 repeat protein